MCKLKFILIIPLQTCIKYKIEFYLQYMTVSVQVLCKTIYEIYEHDTRQWQWNYKPSKTTYKIYTQIRGTHGPNIPPGIHNVPFIGEYASLNNGILLLVRPLCNMAGESVTSGEMSGVNSIRQFSQILLNILLFPTTNEMSDIRSGTTFVKKWWRN